MDNFILIVIVILFSLYGLTCALECAFSLVLFSSRLTIESKYKKVVKDYWLDAFNFLILLILFIFALLMHHTYLNFPSQLHPYILLIGIGIVAKVICRFILYSNSNNQDNKMVKYLYLLSAFITPLALSSLGIYLITGKQFWTTLVGWSLILSAFFGLLVIGLSGINKTKELSKNIKLKQFLEIIFGVWIVLLGFVFPLSLQHFNGSIIGISLSIMEIIIVVSALGYAYANLKQKKPNELYHYSFMIGFMVPLLLAWNNRPFLIIGKIPIYQAFRSASYLSSFKTIEIVVVFTCLIAIIIGTYTLASYLNISVNKAKN